MKTKGASARAGDVIPYVFCLKDGEDSSKTAQADRAKHPDEVKRAADEVKIGEVTLAIVQLLQSWKLVQIMTFICHSKFYRLLSVFANLLKAPIELDWQNVLVNWLRPTWCYSVDPSCSGLDPMRFRNTTSDPDQRVFTPLDTQLSDQERFKDATPLLLRCCSCKGQLIFSPLHDREVCTLLSPCRMSGLRFLVSAFYCPARRIYLSWLRSSLLVTQHRNPARDSN